MARRRRAAAPGPFSDMAPKRLLSKMAALQAVFYLSVALVASFSAVVWGQPVGAGLVLDWELMRSDVTFGWVLALAWILNAVVCALASLYIVQRSKLVLDFSLTAHFIHFLAVSLYSHSVPRNMFWWLVQILAAFTMAILGISVCQWRELKPQDLLAPRTAGGRATGAQDGASRPTTSDGRDLEEGIELQPLNPEGRVEK